MHALIDGDYLKYNVGFGGEHTDWLIRDREQGDKEVIRFPGKRELNAAMKEGTYDDERYIVDSDKTIKPLHFVLARVDATLNSIMKETKSDTYEVWLSGERNFRNEIVDYYKGNRDPNHKPHWFNHIHNHLLNCHDAKITDGIEADDALGLYQEWRFGKQSDTIICTVDKDLDTVPGWHYWTDRGVYYVTQEEAIRFFYKQLLMGDKSTDNIEGIPGIGPAKAEKLLEPANGEEQYRQVALTAYTVYYGDEAAAKMDENAQLLWIQRRGRIKWTDIDTYGGD